MLLNIFIDGASRGNPGPAGIGVVILDKDGKAVKEVKDYLDETTNNIAEYRAFLRALSEARLLGAKELSVNTDSLLLVNQLNRSYKVKDAGIKVLYNEALSLINNFEKVRVSHIERAKNSRADKLANEAIDSSKIKSKPFKEVAVFDNRKILPESLFEN